MVTTIDLSQLNGTNGFVINGIDEFDYSGVAIINIEDVSNGGDLNGDGFDEIIIGSPYADPNNKPSAGQSYLVLGSPNIGRNGSLELSELNGLNGVIIDGIEPVDTLGYSVSNGGDINGDGFDDIIIGAPNADPNGEYDAGENYVVFGKNNIFGVESISGSNEDDLLRGTTNRDRIFSQDGNDTVRGLLENDFIDGGAGNDSLFGNNGNDELLGGAGADTLSGNLGNDSIDGGVGNDRLFGNLGNDFIVGNAGNDFIVGNAGNDTLIGSQGLDTLLGGAGADIFVIARGQNTTRIKDYVDGEDKIDLTGSLSFNDLTFVQNGSNVQIRASDNNEFLIAVENTDVTAFEINDFF